MNGIPIRNETCCELFILIAKELGYVDVKMTYENDLPVANVGQSTAKLSTESTANMFLIVIRATRRLIDKHHISIRVESSSNVDAVYDDAENNLLQ